MKSIHIYAYMLVCWNCAVRHRYRVWNILHVVALVSFLQKSVCHAALSYDTTDILPFIAAGKSGGVNASITLSVTFDEAYKTHVLWSIAITNRYYPQRYLKYWAKLYYNYMSDFQCSYNIYMISAVTCCLAGRGGAHVTKYQPDPKSLCSRKGLNSYAMSFHPLSIASIPRQKNVKKK